MFLLCFLLCTTFCASLIHALGSDKEIETSSLTEKRALISKQSYRIDQAAKQAKLQELVKILKWAIFDEIISKVVPLLKTSIFHFAFPLLFLGDSGLAVIWWKFLFNMVFWNFVNHSWLSSDIQEQRRRFSWGVNKVEMNGFRRSLWNGKMRLESRTIVARLSTENTLEQWDKKVSINLIGDFFKKLSNFSNHFIQARMSHHLPGDTDKEEYTKLIHRNLRSIND